jgi:antitoxin component of MazEF toxin-antitoxin module
MSKWRSNRFILRVVPTLSLLWLSAAILLPVHAEPMDEQIPGGDEIIQQETNSSLSLINSVIGEFDSDFQTVVSEISSLLTQADSMFSDVIPKDILSAVQSVLGALGLPDPQQAAAKVNEQIESDRVNITPFDPTPAHDRIIAQHATTQVIARSDAQGVLGEKGQEMLKEQVTQSQESLESIAAAAEEAQSMTITQDVMKQLALQQSQAATLEGMQVVQGTQIQRQLAVQNLTLADIAQSVDQENLRDNADAINLSTQVMKVSAQTYLH